MSTPAQSVTNQAPYTMRAIILITLFIIHTNATLDLDKVKQVAGLKLQTVTDHAAQTLHTITENIDLDKIKQLDFLNIIPRIQDRLSHVHGKKLDAVRFYLKKAKGLTGSDVIVAFDSVPWGRSDDYQ